MEINTQAGNWTMKRSGPSNYDRDLGFAYVPDARLDKSNFTKRMDSLDEMFRDRKISAIKYLGKMIGFLWEERANIFMDNITRRTEGLKKEKDNVRVLDLMDYGHVIRKLGTSGLSVALEDPRSDSEREYDIQNKIGFVKGNVFSSQTWEEIYKDVKENGPFDMILCRPWGAKKFIPNDTTTYSLMVRRMYRILNPNSGLLLTQYGGEMDTKVKEFSNRINSIEGIKSRCLGGAFSIAREPVSPNKIATKFFIS